MKYELDVGASSEFSLAFHQGMVDRMDASFGKYGPLELAYPDKVDSVASLLQRVELYLHGGLVKGQQIPAGNTEYLIDASNFAMITFMRPRLTGARFVPTTEEGSPGRVHTDGSVSERANDE